MSISRIDLPNIFDLAGELLRLLENLPKLLRDLEKRKAEGSFDPHTFSERGFVANTPRDALEAVRDKLLQALAPSKDEGLRCLDAGIDDITDSDLDLAQKVALKKLWRLCAHKWHGAYRYNREETILDLLEWRRLLAEKSAPNKPAESVLEVGQERKAPPLTGDPLTGAKALSPLQYDILDALRRLKATDTAKRKTAADIATTVGGGATDQSVKAPLADLRRQDLVDSVTGRHGGTWLTPQGLNLINTLRPNH